MHLFIPRQVHGTGAILAANHSGVEVGGWIIRTDNYTLVVPTQVGIDVMHTMDLSDPHRVLSGCHSPFPNPQPAFCSPMNIVSV